MEMVRGQDTVSRCAGSDLTVPDSKHWEECHEPTRMVWIEGKYYIDMI